MLKAKWLNLQLFGGEGAGAGASGASGATDGGEAATGANATADAEQRLRDLGVPEDRIRKRASKLASKMPAKQVDTVTVEQINEATDAQSAPAEEKPTEEKADAPARMSWDEIMKDPEYNKQMQKMMSARVKSSRAAEETLGKLTPALEVLATKYGLDPSNIDYEALSKKISDDDSYYEDKAIEMGVSVETARKLVQSERNTEREKAQAERTLQEQKIQQHFDTLEKQGEELRKTFPNFDLRTELQNPAFARMTSPNIGISVADAYYAVHRNEIRNAENEAVAKRTAERVANAVASNSRRPDESGTSSQAPSVTTFDYRKASPEQRSAFKANLRTRWANGETVYPGKR